MVTTLYFVVAILLLVLLILGILLFCYAGTWTNFKTKLFFGQSLPCHYSMNASTSSSYRQ